MLLKTLMPLIAGQAAMAGRVPPPTARATNLPVGADPSQRGSAHNRSTKTRDRDEERASTIASGIRVEGEVSGSGVIRIHGTVVGAVRAQHKVHVVEGGTVEGDIHAQEAILGGEVVGSIVAEGRVEATADAVIHGDITTPNLTVHEGATVCGTVHMVKQPKVGDAH